MSAQILCFRLLLHNELKLFRTSVPIHAVALLQPTLLYVLMSTILVHPTFEMRVERPSSAAGEALVAAMERVGSPIGLPYIQPVLVDEPGREISRQVVAVEERGGVPSAVQHFGLVDSNLVKNYRNRLTAAALLLWEEELGPRAVVVEQHPWLPRDVPYSVYFGMAVLPMAVFVAGSMLGAILAAQEFELGTVVEYRLAPLAPGWVLAARLVRLVLLALIGAVILLVAIALVTGVWPSSPGGVLLILLPVAVIAGALGTLAGLLLRRTIPAFLVALIASFVGWLMGSAFGLAAGFSGWYERLSRLTPFTHAVELLFPHYYGAAIGRPAVSILFLLLISVAMITLTAIVYHSRILRQA
ncbi:MAG: ABC transporter permease [Anaerolineae bacterium]|nr:ABC transporter permease [Anaerolineae bacterium]